MKMPRVKSSSRSSADKERTPVDVPVIYGLLGITHGSGHVMHLLSPSGAQAIVDLLSGREGLRHVNPGATIPCFLELRDGTFDTLVQELGIEILGKDQWDLRKAELKP
jgi:hypothetical protein